MSRVRSYHDYDAARLPRWAVQAARTEEQRDLFLNLFLSADWT